MFQEQEKINDEEVDEMLGKIEEEEVDEDIIDDEIEVAVLQVVQDMEEIGEGGDRKKVNS